MPGLTVIVGITGTVGSRIAQKLAAKGLNVRGIARHLANAPKHPKIELKQADLTDPNAAETALQGAEAIYLTPPEGGDEPLNLESKVSENVIAAAKKIGIKHLVMHTAMHSDKGNTGVGLLDNKNKLEQKLKASGVPYTILRPAWFMQNLFGAKQYLEQGMLSMPFSVDRRIGGVSVEDIAEAAVQFLAKGPQNRGFDLYVPGGVSGTILSEAATKVLNKQVQFQEFTGPGIQYVDGFPISKKHKELYGELFEYFRKDDYLGKPEEIKQAIPGFQYTTPEQFMRKELFQ